MLVFFPWLKEDFIFRSKHPKTVLIMDEVDGMSAGDRGGVADLIASIKISKIPIICICNDRYSQKLKSLVNYCLAFNYRKPTKQQVGLRLLLCFLHFIMIYWMHSLPCSGPMVVSLACLFCTIISSRALGYLLFYFLPSDSRQSVPCLYLEDRAIGKIPQVFA